MADAPKYVGSWEVVRPLGSGGQGEVFVVRAPQYAELRTKSIELLSDAFNTAKDTGRHVTDKFKAAEALAGAIHLVNNSESPVVLGAGKIFSIKRLTTGQDIAIKRLKQEVAVLSEVDHPAIIRLLDKDPASGWMVTQYHQRGSLEGSPQMFKGDALAALLAIRPLVEAVKVLHDRNVVHRDIKPPNVFVASDGGLVLGDFGILYFGDADRTRVTDTLEKVGSTDWMPPWVHTGERLADVPKSFDLYAIGKLLWSMISGKRVLPYWYWNRPMNNLEEMFPGRVEMQVVNEEVIAKTVVENEGDCCGSAAVLLSQIDQALRIIRLGGGVMRKGRPWPCRICGIGMYEPLFDGSDRIALLPPVGEAGKFIGQTNQLTVHVHRCSTCYHVELFHWPKDNPPSGWKERHRR